MALKYAGMEASPSPVSEQLARLFSEGQHALPFEELHEILEGFKTLAGPVGVPV